MRAVIKHNGTEIPEAMCLVNTANNIVTLERMDKPNILLDMSKVYVEVNLFGSLESVGETELD